MKTNKVTQGEWYVSDIEQANGYYIYSKHNILEAIARVYKSDDRPNSKCDAEYIVDSVNSITKLRNENESLKIVNAELIEALKIAEKFMTDDTTSEYHEAVSMTAIEAFEIVEKAIAKAESKQ